MRLLRRYLDSAQEKFREDKLPEDETLGEVYENALSALEKLKDHYIGNEYYENALWLERAKERLEEMREDSP